MVTLYHGTSAYNLTQFLTTSPIKRLYRHRKKKGFCTTVSFEEASYFAIRKCSINDFLENKDNYGIVLEFEFDGDAHDFEEVKHYNTLRNEKEVMIFNTKKLKLVAYYQYQKDKWERGERCLRN